MAKKKLSDSEASAQLTKRELELIRNYNDSMFFDEIKPTYDEDTKAAFNKYYELKGWNIPLQNKREDPKKITTIMKRDKTFIKATVDIRKDEDIYKLLNCKKFKMSPYGRGKNKVMIRKDDDDEPRMAAGGLLEGFSITLITDPYLTIDLVEAEKLLQSADERFAEFRRQVKRCSDIIEDYKKRVDHAKKINS